MQFFNMIPIYIKHFRNWQSNIYMKKLVYFFCLCVIGRGQTQVIEEFNILEVNLVDLDYL